MGQEKFFGGLVKVGFLILLVQSFYLQILRFPLYSALSKKQSIRTIEVGIPRGRILDRNGRILAEDVPCFNLVFVPYDLKAPREEAMLISSLLGLERERLMQVFTRSFRNPFDRVVIKKNLTEEEVAAVEENAYHLPGIFVQLGIDRHYPLQEDTCHLLGYTGEISREQLEVLKEKGLKPGDVIGQDGLEKYYDDYLRGVPGGLLVEVDALGHHRKELGKTEGKPGHNLILTIDQTFQEIAAEMLGGRAGCVVAMDPRNGQVLALVSRPGFEPDRLENYLRRPGNPFLNRAIQAESPPGSVFKIITEIAGLESGAMEERDRVECTGEMTVADVVFHCWKEEGHGWVDIDLALPFSCNIYFGTLGLKTGVDKILEYGRMFNLGERTGIDLPGEKNGNLPNAAVSGGPLNVAIGQGALLTTPLQMLSLISTVANSGNIWRPYTVKKIVSPDGKTAKEFTSALSRTVYVSSDTMDILKKGLKNVVTMGTGAGARVEKLEVAGKTGTAQRAHLELELPTRGAFACYAAADEPSVALVVYLDQGASSEAARIAGRILKKVFLPAEEGTEEDSGLENEPEALHED